MDELINIESKDGQLVVSSREVAAIGERSVKTVKIVIKGDAKEIADLVLAVQGQPNEITNVEFYLGEKTMNAAISEIIRDELGLK